jgi:hypothetical protein
MEKIESKRRLYNLCQSDALMKSLNMNNNSVSLNTSHNNMSMMSMINQNGNSGTISAIKKYKSSKRKNEIVSVCDFLIVQIIQFYKRKKRVIKFYQSKL